MQNRTRDIVTLVQAADLELVRHYREAARTCAVVRAKNGNTHTFSISCNGKADMRGDQIAMQKMRRFGRENAIKPEVSSAIPVLVAVPLTKSEVVKAPKKRTTITMKAKSATNDLTSAVLAGHTAQAAAISAAAQELTPKEFYKLCDLLKHSSLLPYPSLEALTMHVRSTTTMPVTDAIVTEAMEAVELAAPDHWNAPLDPHIVLARELETLMKSLGNEPSREFTRLLGTLAA